MTYENIAAISQVATLLMFFAMFLLVVAYALWPSNGDKFARIQRQSLDLDARQTKPEARHE